ncbi:hypothetical protein SDC9_160803 [bioreactor metagenome]|uniref:Uncharacterized protein n=1 Tax=bioreactor metagenome TaxID=1076179 RepID=A0A645FIX7_9ZZZZ
MLQRGVVGLRLVGEHVGAAAVRAVFALDEGALLAHFDLDGTGLAGSIGLLDFASGFFHQSNFLAICTRRAMAGLQIGKQLLLVRLGQGIARRCLCHSRCLQLIQQHGGGFLEFGCELGDCVTRHIVLVPP